MSLGSAIERSDGSFEFEKGFLRHAVDAAGEAVFEARINEMPVNVVKMFSAIEFFTQPNHTK